MRRPNLPGLTASALVAVFAAVACSSPEAASRSSSSPNPSASAPIVTATSVSTAPMPACRLPIASGLPPLTGIAPQVARGQGGFLSLPAGTFTSDPNSLASYDWAIDKWLPVQAHWISPDGSQYAWPEYSSPSDPPRSFIHVVDARTGADRALAVPAPSVPVSFETSGIYLTRIAPASEAIGTGLALLDPASGNLRQLIPDGHWELVSGSRAYGGDLDPSIPQATLPREIANNRIRQVNLSTGNISTYLSRGGAALDVLGLNSDNLPLVGVSDLSGYKVVVYSGSASDFTELFAGSLNALDNPTGPTATSGGVSWLSSGAGAVWLLDATRTLHRVAASSPQHAIVAGSCH